VQKSHKPEENCNRTLFARYAAQFNRKRVKPMPNFLNTGRLSTEARGLCLCLALILTACSGSSGAATTSTPTIPLVANNTTLVNGLAINNFNNNDTIRYSLPLLYGLTQTWHTSVQLDTNGVSYQASVVNGAFKAAIPLRPGANEITIKTGSTSNKFTLNYAPADNQKKVSMMLAVASDDEGRFIAEPGVDNSIEAARQKVSVMALLMQSATAEMLHKAGKPRMTYALVENANGQPQVDILRLPTTRAELRRMNDKELYDIIKATIRNTTYDVNLKYMVTMSFSGYAGRKVVGHTALGGGFLSIFGSLYLHTCPNSLSQVNAAFSNNRMIDLNSFPDDSNGRMSYWANCATGMGASLHELAHSFKLAHTPTGIMARGFDNFNRLFMMREPGLETAITRDKEAGAAWDPASVDALLKSDWIKK
jgi:Putative peptidase family